MFDVLFSILRSDMQPWLPKNLHNERFYQQLVNDTDVVHCSNPVYRVDFHDVRYVPAMALYYQRLVDNELNSWLNSQRADKNLGLTPNQIRYRHSLYSNIFDELLSHTDEIIHRYGYSIDSVIGRDVIFQEDAQAKICTLICFHIQASLVTTYITWQEYFRNNLLGNTIYESPEQVVFHFLKHALPESISIATIVDIAVTPNEPTIATTVAQQFIDTVQPYQFVSMPKIAKLTSSQQTELIEKMVKDGAWAAAMLEFLGYHERLEKNYKLSKQQIYKHCAKALGISDSSYKKYVLSLHNPELPSYERHNASIHTIDVEKFYNSLL